MRKGDSYKKIKDIMNYKLNKRALMPKKEIRNQNSQRKWLGCRDVYLKSSSNLNYKSGLISYKKMSKKDSYKKITRHNELQIK